MNSTFKLSELKSIESEEQKLRNEKEERDAKGWNDFREGAYKAELEKMVICKCEKPEAWFTALNTCRNCNGEIYSDLKRTKRYFSEFLTPKEHGLKEFERRFGKTDTKNK